MRKRALYYVGVGLLFVSWMVVPDTQPLLRGMILGWGQAALVFAIPRFRLLEESHDDD